MDCTSSALERFEPTKLHKVYSDIVDHLLYSHGSLGPFKKSTLSFQDSMQPLKTVSKGIFETLFDVNFFTLKFHVLNYVQKDELSYGELTLLHSSLFEHFNYVIKSS